ncbi:MAG: response regulator [Catonella sp.]|nr:response regulator [Catonella sp.]MDY6355811.1 response regulator [Catonella sp.]
MVDDKKYRILLIEKGASMIAASLAEKLGAAGNDVIKCPADVNAINAEKDVSAVILYGSPDLVDDMKVMTFLSDTINEHGLPYYIIGDNKELDAFKKFPDSGRRAEFTRPVNVDEAAQTISEDLAGVFSKKKILVVDDSGTMLRKIKGWLEGKYKITLANSGARAMKALALEIPDLVLLDYEMPIVDGRQVLGMIRDEPEYANIPVIFLTGKSDAESVKSVLSLKPEGYLLKTEEPAKIIAEIDKFFSK